MKWLIAKYLITAAVVVCAIAMPFPAGAVDGMLGGRKLAARLDSSQLQKGFAAVSAGLNLAVIIDPVDRHWERNLRHLQRPGLQLAYALETTRIPIT